MAADKELTKQGAPSIENSGKQIVQQVIASSYSGPLPPAEAFEQYERVCPGAADRIISLAENQAEHRRALETLHEQTIARNSKMGILCALIMAVSVLIGGVACILTGHDYAGGIIVSLDLVSLCGVFIYGTKLQGQ